MLATMTLLILAQTYAEASSPNIPPCYDESDYPNLLGDGTSVAPYILSANKCLRIVNSIKGFSYVAKFTLKAKNLRWLEISAATADNRSCKNTKTPDCLNYKKNIYMSVTHTNMNSDGKDQFTRECTGDKGSSMCLFSAKNGIYKIALKSSDAELLHLSVQTHTDSKSNFNSGVN